jgi:hypothetical protein
MAPFHPPTGGTAGHRSAGRYLARLQSHTPSLTNISDEDPPQSSANNTSNPRAGSNDATRSSLCTILSLFHLGRHGVKNQPSSATQPGRTDAGIAEPTPLESEPEPPLSPQQTPQNYDAEMARQDLAWLFDQLASSDARASARSSEDDANSDHTELVSEDEDDAEDAHQYVVLGAYNTVLNRLMFFFGIIDTGAAVSVLSYAKARLVAPDGISDDFSKVGTRTLDILGGKVTVHGPIWVKFCLRSQHSRKRYKAPFYVLPSSYGEGGFDALLNIKLVQRLGLVEIQRDPAAEIEARKGGTSRSGGSSLAE